MWLVGLDILGVGATGPAGACGKNSNNLNPSSAIARI
jgi:hypothetical protein